jgi:hypothetical protein
MNDVEIAIALICSRITDMDDSSNTADFPRLDRTAFKATSHEEQAAEGVAYWRSRTEGERMEELERLRMVLYGYDPTTARLQRVLRVLEPRSSEVPDGGTPPPSAPG